MRRGIARWLPYLRDDDCEPYEVWELLDAGLCAFSVFFEDSLISPLGPACRPNA